MSAVMTIEELRRGLSRRKNFDKLFVVLGLLIMMGCLGVLALLFLDLVRDGASRFGWDFLTQFLSPHGCGVPACAPCCCPWMAACAICPLARCTTAGVAWRKTMRWCCSTRLPRHRWRVRHRQSGR